MNGGLLMVGREDTFWDFFSTFPGMRFDESKALVCNCYIWKLLSDSIEYFCWLGEGDDDEEMFWLVIGATPHCE